MFVFIVDDITPAHCRTVVDYDCDRTVSSVLMPVPYNSAAVLKTNLLIAGVMIVGLLGASGVVSRLGHNRSVEVDRT